jgi:hypothetical protein
MIKYTEKQWECLYKEVLFEQVNLISLEAFMIKKNWYEKRHIKNLNTDQYAVYNKLLNIQPKKIDRKNRYYSQEEYDNLCKIREIIFKVEWKKLPLYINDPILNPIIAWRLRSNI